MLRPAVIVMLKAPRAGLVKTRLVPPLSAEASASLAACLAQDVVRGAAQAAGETIIAYAPADGRAALGELLPGRHLWLEQRGRDLGERLASAAARAFAHGFGPLIFIGADSPTLPHAFIDTAIGALVRAESDIALGPTDDGGYYLVGLRRDAPGLFKEIEWSTARAYAQTLGNARALGLRALELPRWYDVDTYADLLRLRADIRADAETRRRAPATARWLEEHDAGETGAVCRAPGAGQDVA